MSKRLILILALAFMVGATFTAYAEVQNVKVSGDLDIKHVYRDNLDLTKANTTPGVGTAATGNLNSDIQGNFLTITRIRVDADLTDNVSTTVRLINERDWQDDNTQALMASNDIDIDLAYATLKEFLYSPLSITVGRQELHYGNDLIVGDPDTNGLAPSSTLAATESDLSPRKSFDAIKAVLNYDPLVIDLVYAKLGGAVIAGATANDDTNLYGINANYALDKETTIEAYSFSKVREAASTINTAAQRTTAVALTTTPNKIDTVYTFGARAVNTSVKNLTAQLEGAFQAGNYNPGFDVNAQNASLKGPRKAFAIQTIANYNLADLLLEKYKPSIMGSYTYLSGEVNTRVAGAYHGWDPMFENQTLGHIVNRIMGYTNSQILTFSGKVAPMEDVTLNLDYANYWLNKKFPELPIGGAAAGVNTSNLRGVGAQTYVMRNKKHLGQELDATLTYDYTEDVQFSLLSGVFFPGKAFESSNNDNATEFIGSMKVTF